MANHAKRTEVICTKVDEQMALALLRQATQEDRSISEYLFLLIRSDLYGKQGRACADDTQSTNGD